MTAAALRLPPVLPEAPASAEALRAAVPGARVTVVGGARSGLSVARLLARRGADVFLSDHGAAEAGTAEALARDGVGSEFGGHTARALDCDWVVLSPGVPTTSDLVQTALRQRQPVYSEIEVASWFCPGPIVAVTGSNGKTTTTSLVAHVCATDGRAHVVQLQLRAGAELARRPVVGPVIKLERKYVPSGPLTVPLVYVSLTRSFKAQS